MSSQARTPEYWIERAERRLLAAERQGAELSREVIRFYSNTNRQLQRDVDAFYGRYATDNQLSMEEARVRLTPNERFSFQSQLDFYLSEAKEKGLDKNYEAYLRTLSGKSHITRQQELIAECRHQIEISFSLQERAFTSTLVGICEDSYYRAIFDIQVGLGFGSPFSKMNTKVIESILRKPWLGDNYSSRIWKNKTRLLQQLDQIIPQAFALGQNSRVLGGELAKKLGVSRRAAERLVRTEVNHICNEAAKASYRECGVKKYQYISTLDNRTSAICAALDNRVFLLSDAQVGINYPPMHPNCRSTTIPYFELDDLDIGAKRAARNDDGVYYLVPADTDYGIWREEKVA